MPRRQAVAAAGRIVCRTTLREFANTLLRAAAASRQLVCTSAFLAQLARRWRRRQRWRQQAHHCTGHSWHSLSGILHGLYVMIRVQYLVLEPCFARTYYVAQEVHKELHTWRRRPRLAQVSTGLRDCEYTVVLTLLDSAHFFLRSAHTLAQCHRVARLNYSNIHKMDKHQKNYKYHLDSGIF